MSPSTLARPTILLLLLSGLVLAGCSGALAPPPGTMQRSELGRELAPSVSSEDAATLRRGATDFALEMHRRAAALGENVITSPLSIHAAFGTLRPGALGTTAEEIDAALGWRLPLERLLPALSHVDLELAKRNRDGVSLTIVNQAFTQQGFPLEGAYLDALAVHFGAGIAEWDFVTDAQTGRVAINEWVSNRTAGHIPDLLPPDSVTSDTRLVLVNAVHFHGTWQHQFDPSETRSETFTLESGESTAAPLMRIELDDALAAFTDAFDAVELPYAGGELAMLLVLPSGTLAEFEASLDASAFEAIVAALTPVEALSVVMPRFEFRTEVDLVPTLQDLGMHRVFANAELEGISRTGGLYVSGAVHAATIAVDEAGTVATAATAAVVGVESATPSIRLVRPFFFAIRDRTTGTLIFVGRVADPTAS